VYKLEYLKFNDIIIFKLLIKDQWVSQEINGVRDNEPVLLNIFFPINVKITIIALFSLFNFKINFFFFKSKHTNI
jgi:hypothetical protein